jgi:hypothetical protein
MKNLIFTLLIFLVFNSNAQEKVTLSYKVFSYEVYVGDLIRLQKTATFYYNFSSKNCLEGDLFYIIGPGKYNNIRVKPINGDYEGYIHQGAFFDHYGNIYTYKNIVEALEYKKYEIAYQNACSPGTELIKFSTRMYTGMAINVLGTGIILSSNNLTTTEKIENLLITEKIKNRMLIGGVFCLVGTVIMIESYSHVYKAGLLLNESGVGIKIPIK